MKEGKRPFWRLNNPFIWGWGASILIVGSFVVMAMLGQCAAPLSEQIDCPTKLRALSAAPLNEVGDALAGFAGALAFVWLFIAVWLQSQELQEQRKQIDTQTDEFKNTNYALAAQRFDSAFFSMILTYSQMLSDMDTTTSSDTDKSRISNKGRDCFTLFIIRLRKSYRDRRELEGEPVEVLIRSSYANFWSGNQNDLGHYFRFLYNFFRFLDESQYTQVHHGRLLRSQLSDQELVILYYNCLSSVGEPFQRYARKFALFDNLPGNLLISQEHAKLMHREAWGRNPFAQFGHTNP